eukprot:TRINITY_DN2603_c0_g1_i1.p1 TRINITY_DN2603_c0_g1~~TRINITY_DN2603_c0_g1_i1.p1  ORF type:complete len:325 (-),score=28.81 TRINITY_DN2603_c0_g1_i1:52-1026(-)
MSTEQDNNNNSPYQPLPELYSSRPSSSETHCDNSLVSGPDRGGFYFLFASIIILSIVFFSITGPYLWIKLNPVLCVIPIYPIFQLLATLFLAGYSDPGIIPRDYKKRDNPKPTNNEQERGTYQSQNQKPAKYVKIKSIPFYLKYCKTCEIYRPPRASHCPVCNNCVEKFDHHCSVIGNCIGKRNYRFFISFIGWATFCSLYCGGCCLAQIITEIQANYNTSFFQATGKSIEAHYPENIIGSSLLLFILCWLIISVGSFFGYHCSLVMKDQTTHEQMKKVYNDRRNPFSRGCLLNSLSLFCSFPSTSFVKYDLQNPPDTRDIEMS